MLGSSYIVYFRTSRPYGVAGCTCAAPGSGEVNGSWLLPPRAGQAGPVAQPTTMKWWLTTRGQPGACHRPPYGLPRQFSINTVYLESNALRVSYPLSLKVSANNCSYHCKVRAQGIGSVLRSVPRFRAGSQCLMANRK